MRGSTANGNARRQVTPPKISTALNPPGPIKRPEIALPANMAAPKLAEDIDIAVPRFASLLRIARSV
jgi:hypothetical protein